MASSLLHPAFRTWTSAAWEGFIWLLAALWLWRSRELILHLPEVEDLTQPEWDVAPATMPALTVIVPARNEEQALPMAMATLLRQEYLHLEILAVDDRSTDRTGEILQSFEQQHPDRVRVLHLTELPEGWLGKTWALEVATLQTRTPYVLFTDADVLFSPSVLRRALAYAEFTRADHLVVIPSPEVRRWDEGVMLGLLQIAGNWAVRSWRVSDPHSPWDAVGIGAFNLIRRDAWDELGGFWPQRMAVLEDVTLGRRVKATAQRQRIAFAPGLVRVHWAPGMLGIIRALSKNLFAIVNFSLLGLLGLMAGITLLFLAPLAALFWWRTTVPALLILACIAAQYRTLAEVSEIPAHYGWLYPLGVVALLWALLRSAGLAILRQAIVWRGTRYPLADLRPFNSPTLWWRRAQHERLTLVEDRRIHRREFRRRMRKWR